jgi:iron complex outermembrane receptor protein
MTEKAGLEQGDSMSQLRFKQLRRAGLYCIAALTSISLAATTWAQSGANGAAVAAEGNNVLSEVVVTALRRETKMSDTPIAMSAVTAEDIDRQRIVNFNDLQLSIPNFIFEQVTRQETFISIRGTSVDNDTPGTDQGVAVFIDGVPRTGVHDYNPDLFDLQSVEVLRGPQGTLFGRNTTGGAVLIHTTAPSFQPMYRAQVSYGSNNLEEVNLLATGPVMPGILAGKFAVSVHHRDGTVDNLIQGRDNGMEKAGSLRAQVLWAPDDSLKVLFSADYLRDLSESRVGTLEGTFVPSLFPGLQYGPDVTNSPFPPRASNTIFGASITADWTASTGTLTSITGYRAVTPSITYNAVGDPSAQLLAEQTVKDRQITEELHFASNALGRFRYLAGLFYLHVDRLDDTLYTVANPQAGVAAFITPLGEVPAGFQNFQGQSVLTESRAVFGEATYSALDSLDVTLGARYSSERRSGHSEDLPSPFFAGSSGPYSHTWGAFTPKANVAYRPVTGILLYGTVSKGFQSGGYEATAATPELMRTPFNPETVINYELGAKVIGFDQRLSTNVGAFLADYSNLQRTAFDSNPAVNAYRTTNAGKARVKGIELDATYLATDWLKLGLSYAYTDAKYREYAYLVTQADGSTQKVDYAGHTLPQTPRQQVHVSEEISIPWAATDGVVITGADYTYRSEIQFVDANDTPQSILDKTRYNGIINAHVGWQSNSGHWVVNVFAKNISDKRALVNLPDFTPYFATPAELGNPGNHIYLSRYSPRRLIGVSFTAKF